MSHNVKHNLSLDPWGTLRLSKRELRDLQNKKLKSFISTHLYPFSPHYQRLFKEAKLNPRSIQTIQDLKHIPFTSKTDLLATDAAPEKFKDFILQPDKEKIRQNWPKTKLLKLAFKSKIFGAEFVQEELGREYRPMFMTFTTGSTNKPVAFMYSQYDIQNLFLSGSRMLDLFDIKSSDRIVNAFPYAPHLAFWQVVFGGMSSGVLILSTGGGKTIGTEANIAAILKMKPAVLLGVPSYIYHLLRTAHEKGARMEFLKKIVLGAARVTEPFKLRLASLVESMGGSDVSVFGTYGFTEARSAWAECPTTNDTSSGYHLYPDKDIFEIIDPDTGEVKKEGEDGEIVFTSIDARASTVVRYRTGDFCKGGLTYEPCPHCGRIVPRLSSDITRISDVKDLKLSKIKGTLVDLNNMTTVLTDTAEIEEWQLEIKKRNDDPFDVDEVIVYVCPVKNCNQDKLKEDIKKQIALASEVTPNDVVFLPFAEIVKRIEIETAAKEKRVIDRRPK